MIFSARNSNFYKLNITMEHKSLFQRTADMRRSQVVELSQAPLYSWIYYLSCSIKQPLLGCQCYIYKKVSKDLYREKLGGMLDKHHGLGVAGGEGVHVCQHLRAGRRTPHPAVGQTPPADPALRLDVNAPRFLSLRAAATQSGAGVGRLEGRGHSSRPAGHPTPDCHVAGSSQ